MCRDIAKVSRGSCHVRRRDAVRLVQEKATLRVLTSGRESLRPEGPPRFAPSTDVTYDSVRPCDIPGTNPRNFADHPVAQPWSGRRTRRRPLCRSGRRHRLHRRQ